MHMLTTTYLRLVDIRRGTALHCQRIEGKLFNVSKLPEMNPDFSDCGLEKNPGLTICS